MLRKCPNFTMHIVIIIIIIIVVVVTVTNITIKLAKNIKKWIFKQ